MAPPDHYPRFSAGRLVEALSDSPVTLIHGPRQCGKTTLARTVGDRLGYRYFSFDDDVTRAAAEADPASFIDNLPSRAILDEVQRVPAIFSTIKLAVDRDRRPGRLLLAGSTNMLLLPRLADSLAGRMAIVRLHPLSQAELERRKPNFLERLFGPGFRAERRDRLRGELVERVVAGGYPAALARRPGRRRDAWYADYLETVVQRDARLLARISSLDALPRLLALAATQTAQLVNVSDLAAPFQLSRPTINDYVTILERLFLVDRVPPWHSNRLSRLVKSPKLHLGDTGMAATLLGVNAAALGADRALLGHLVETFAFQEIRRQAAWHEIPSAFFHFRDRDGTEVDIVVEQGTRHVAGVEVKASATVTAADFRGLRRLQEAAGERFGGGAVLYDGETCASFGPRLYAVPIRLLWQEAA